jgi:hypothetical protein
VSPLGPVILAVIPAPLMILRRGASIRARAGLPASLPAGEAGVVGIQLWLEEVEEPYGQFQVGALVAVNGVASPALVEAVHQASHPAVVLPREEVPREEELCVPAVELAG